MPLLCSSFDYRFLLLGGQSTSLYQSCHSGMELHSKDLFGSPYKKLIDNFHLLDMLKRSSQRRNQTGQNSVPVMLPYLGLV